MSIEDHSPPQLVPFGDSEYQSTEGDETFVFPQDAYDQAASEEDDATEGGETGTEGEEEPMEDGTEGEDQDEEEEAEEDATETGDGTEAEGTEVEDSDMDRTDVSFSGGEILDVAALMNSGKLEVGGPAEDNPMPSVFEVDVGNLLVFDRQEQGDYIFSGNKEDVIRDLSRLCVQELFDQVFNLSVKPSDKGPIASLPKPKTPIPREKPVPVDKPETRWEKFAKEKVS